MRWAHGRPWGVRGHEISRIRVPGRLSDSRSSLQSGQVCSIGGTEGLGAVPTPCAWGPAVTSMHGARTYTVMFEQHADDSNKQSKSSTDHTKPMYNSDRWLLDCVYHASHKSGAKNQLGLVRMCMLYGHGGSQTGSLYLSALLVLCR